jgi:uncharacterized protein
MLKFRQLNDTYIISRLGPSAVVPDWAMKGGFASITRTADELSIVCPIQNVPEGMKSGPHWVCFKLEGPFPFSQTGVLLSFIQPLSNSGIPIFAISTFDTDYVLIQEEFGGTGLRRLQDVGHQLIS